MLEIKEILDNYLEILKEEFKENLIAVILYGSWVKGTARKDSDIDTLVILREYPEKDKYHKIISKVDPKISIVIANAKDFEKEKIPLYSAVKKEGEIIFGDISLELDSTPWEIKYKEFFEKSRGAEEKKIEMAESLLKEGYFSSIAEFCYVAVKHAIQLALAMKGIGFSSKFQVLIKWVNENFPFWISQSFKILFDLYIKSEYKMEELSKEECEKIIEEAKRILNFVYRESFYAEK